MFGLNELLGIVHVKPIAIVGNLAKTKKQCLPYEKESLAISKKFQAHAALRLAGDARGATKVIRREGSTLRSAT